MANYRAHLFVLCVLAGVLLTGAHTAFQNTITDLRFSLFPRAASGDVVLVGIDSPSIDKIGVWPWPRQLYAQALAKLTQAGASEIVFDIDFSSRSTPDSDAALAEALKRAGGSVILPAFKQIVQGENGTQKIFVNKPLPAFSKNAWQATVNVTGGSDGRMRTYAFGETLKGEFYPAVGALLAGKYETGKRRFQIDFSIRSATIPRMSFADVLADGPKRSLKGKRVIVGGTAVELGDRFTVPVQGTIAGPVLQALAAESILQGRTLHSSSLPVTLLGLAVMMLVMLLLQSRLSAARVAFSVAGLALLFEAAATAIQLVSPVIVETAAWHLAAIAYLIALALQEIDLRGLLARVAERRFSRIAMSLGDGLVCADADGLITLWNRGAASIFGYDAAEITGKPLATLWSDEEGAEAFDIRSIPADELAGPGGCLFELEGRKKDGTDFALEASFSSWSGIDGINYGAILRDISVRKKEEQRIKYLAEHDALTGLFNRNVLRRTLAGRIAEARPEQHEVGLLLLGVDHLKEVNDIIGHARGDEILRSIGQTLQTIAQTDDTVARVSGDEFAVVVTGPDTGERVEKLAREIAGAVAGIPFAPRGGRRHMSCSIGIALYPRDSKSIDALLANADLAMYRAKENGRGQQVLFDAELRDELEVRRTLEEDLSRALRNDEFELFYQPQLRLSDRTVIGAEALARWQHPERGLVPPDEFIPVLNAMPIADAFAHWVMETACRQGRIWEANGSAIRIGVNLSPCQFRAGTLAGEVRDVLAETGLSPHLLELEVTENIVIEDDKAAKDIFKRIQHLGVTIAFDDFGTGYASLNYLKRFALDRLKIDRSFVQELRPDSSDAAIVRSTIELSSELGLAVIAEGIEDDATAEVLLEMGCDEGQGYYFGRPVPAAEFESTFLPAGDAAAPASRAPERRVTAA